jgi:hypothetical protein
VARVLSTAIVLVLLAATAVAFAITERAKVELSPILRTKVDKVFSPAGTAIPVAHIRFRLRTRQRVSVWIQDSHGRKVANLLTNRTFRHGSNLDLIWDGVASNGVVEPDGVYTPVVKLPHRTFVLPSPIRIDTKPPVVKVRHPQYPIISPDGDGRHDRFTVPYTVNERAHGILLVRGRRVEFTLGQKQAGKLVWNGTLGRPPRPVRPGRYLLTISAQDEAGNVAKGFPFAIVQVRYLTLARDRIVVKPGARFALRISTDYPTIDWRLHGASGVQRRGTLHFRAPKSPGVYRLYVTAGSHSAKCAVVVA